jgi:hypothetical protein
VNYKENRRTDYPELFSISYKLKARLEASSTLLQKKMRFVLRRLKLEKAVYG